MKNRVQSTFLYQCFSLNTDDRVAKFYMINMALLCFLLKKWEKYSLSNIVFNKIAHLLSPKIFMDFFFLTQIH